MFIRVGGSTDKQNCRRGMTEKQMCGVAFQQKIPLGGGNCIVSSQGGQTGLWGFEIVQEKLFNLHIRFYSKTIYT